MAIDRNLGACLCMYTSQEKQKSASESRGAAQERSVGRSGHQERRAPIKSDVMLHERRTHTFS
eukprot:6194436-Pleurochrysis_carterae.AAC.2